MKRPAILLALIAAPLLVLACSAEPGNAAQQGEADEYPVQQVEKNDPEMVRAIAEARRTLPQFLAVLAKPPPGARDFMFKFPLGGSEHIWVEQARRRGNALTGRLANTPLQQGWSLGDVVTVPFADVSDWTWRDARGVFQGNRTTRVLLPRLSPEDAAALREQMGWDR